MKYHHSLPYTQSARTNMPTAVESGVRPTVERDDLDDIFNYDAGINATFNQPGQNWSAQDGANDTNTGRLQQDVPENIDEEVKVTKKRKPVAKLDEERYTPTFNTFKSDR
jgi:replication fork protection complex subunit Csm3/Swi3